MTVRSPGLRVATTADAPPAIAVPGPAGKDGAGIAAGEGRPSDDLGEGGDLYLDVESGDLYRKET